MRIFLIHPMGYLAAQGGGTSGNRMLLEDLVQRGHECRVITKDHAAFRLQPSPGTTTLSRTEDEILAVRGGVHVTHLLSSDWAEVDRIFVERLRIVLEGFQPDLVLSMDADVRSLSGGAVFLNWLELALPEIQGIPVIHFSKTPAIVPFGPASFFPDPGQQKRYRTLLEQVRGIITPSEAAAEYLRQHAGLSHAECVPFPAYGAPPYPNLANYSKGLIGTLNLADIKGACIAEGLAAEFPQWRFGARSSWATTPDDIESFSRLPNTEILPFEHDLAEIYRPFRVMLVPSLCFEGLGQVPIEAMAHGIPTISSDCGGLAEAMLGRPHLCHIEPITRYDFDATACRFAARVPPQNLEPWKLALQDVLSSESRYMELSQKGREAALKYIEACSFEHFEQQMFRMAGLAPPTAENSAGARSLD